VFFLWLKYWLHLTGCTWLFLITVLESSGSNERESYFQISAKNKGISQYGEAVLLNVTTQEKGKDNANVMFLINTHTQLMHVYVPIFEILL
jgi:hypothetical protein